MTKVITITAKTRAAFALAIHHNKTDSHNKSTTLKNEKNVDHIIAIRVQNTSKGL